MTTITRLQKTGGHLIIHTDGRYLVVPLNEDQSIRASLAITAWQMREKAAKLIRDAELVEEAMRQLFKEAAS